MREYKTETQPEKSYQKLVKCLCDICGKESNDEFDDPDRFGEYQQVKIEMEDGCSYPESHSYTRYYYDICADCFHDKVINFLREVTKIEPHEESYDW